MGLTILSGANTCCCEIHVLCFEVEIAGIVDDTCTCCDSYNRTWTVPNAGGAGNVWSCKWTGEYLCKTDPELVITLDGSSGNWILTVEFAGHLWEKDYGITKPDITTFTHEEILHDTSDSECTSSGSVFLKALTELCSCTPLSNCNGACLCEAPSEYEVYIPEILPSVYPGATLCSDVNKCEDWGDETVIVPYVGGTQWGTSGAGCGYSFSENRAFTCCGPTNSRRRVIVDIYPLGGGITRVLVVVVWCGFSLNMQWSIDIATPDCYDFDSLNVPFSTTAANVHCGYGVAVGDIVLSAL